MPLLKLQHLRWAFRAILPSLIFCFLGSFGWLEPVGAASPLASISIEDVPVPLAEIKDRHHVALVIVKSSVIDASGSDEPIVTEALAANPKDSTRHRYAYGTIARTLNAYMRKYRSMRPVNEIAQADIIVCFKLVEYRRVLNGTYPYGELFVIVNPRPDERLPARIVWKTKKMMFAEDAVKDFVKELKRVREEH